MSVVESLRPAAERIATRPATHRQHSMCHSLLVSNFFYLFFLMLKKREKSLFLSPAPLIWYSPPQTLYDIEANVQEEE